MNGLIDWRALVVVFTMCMVSTGSAQEVVGIGLLRGVEEPAYLHAGLEEGVGFALAKGVVTSRVLLHPGEGLDISNGVFTISSGLTSETTDLVEERWEIRVIAEWSETLGAADCGLPDMTSKGNNILGFVGPATSSQSTALLETCALDTVIISHLATATGLTDPLYEPRLFTERPGNRKWFFRSTSPDSLRAEALASWLRETSQNDKRIAVVNAKEIYSQNLANDIIKGLRSRNFELISSFEYKVESEEETSLEIGGVIDKLRNETNMGAIVLTGFSKWDSELIRRWRGVGSDDLKIYVIEPHISRKEDIFEGVEFEGIRAISDQPLWNGDFNARQFNTTFLEYYRQETGSSYHQSDVPTQVAYAYDATLMFLAALKRAALLKGKIGWGQMTVADKRDAIRQELSGPMPFGRVMSDSCLTARNEVAVKLQRTEMRAKGDEGNRLWIVTPQPVDWNMPKIFYICLGSLLAISLQLVLFYRNSLLQILSGDGEVKLFNVDAKVHLMYIVYCFVAGMIGAGVTFGFWGAEFLMQILPKFASTLSRDSQIDVVLIGFVGALLPSSMVTLWQRKT